MLLIDNPFVFKNNGSFSIGLCKNTPTGSYKSVENPEKYENEPLFILNASVTSRLRRGLSPIVLLVNIYREKVETSQTKALKPLPSSGLVCILLAVGVT